MHVGLIGGIGPAATAYCYRALVKSFDEAERKLSLTIVHADLQEYAGNMLAADAEAQAKIFADFADQLKAGGCQAVAVTSMAGHFCIAEFEARSSLPVINAIPVLERTFSELSAARVGILGTRMVMDSRLFGISSTQVILPPADEIQRVHDTYIAIAEAGVATHEQRAYFEEMSARLVGEEAVDAIVLGGTDLFLAFDRDDYSYQIIDCAIVHADAIASVAMGNAWAAS